MQQSQATARASRQADDKPLPGESELDLSKLLQALQSVRDGDFSVRLAGDQTGLAGKVADTFNEIVGANQRLAHELARLGQIVGKDGRTRHRISSERRSGAWGAMEQSVNTLIDDLLWPTTEVTRTISAVAKGDLQQAMSLQVDGRALQGEFLRAATIVNTMIAQMSACTSEVTRVAREVGTEGKLGGQAIVPGVAGTWKDLTDSVNSMASNLTGQVRNISEVTIAVANGDLSRKITVDVRGEILQLKQAINTMVDQLRSFASEVTRVAREVGTEGKLGGQAIVSGVAGTWKDLTDSVNAMATNLTGQVRNIAAVTTAVARGDLSRKITVDVKGEILELKNTINTMVDQLNGFAAEVTRVAREVGTAGKLGGQAVVPGVAGTWKDLTDSVNSMAGNLTGQVRNIAEVATAIANGNLSRKITVDVRGEILQLKETVNTMVDQLNSFASEVTRVAREVGTEGKLGGQAIVPGVAGTWKDLTANVNLLAANLTNQVRAIAEVATAVTKGDLTRSIQVQARGEVSELKDNINAMIGNLRATTERNNEQDWLKTNLAKFSRMMQGQRDLVTVGKLLLSELAPLINAQQGIVYVMDGATDAAHLRELASYADQPAEETQPRRYAIGQGLVGQAAADRQRLLITDLPDDSIRIASGLMNARPRHVIVLPVLYEGHVKAVLELASLRGFTASHLAFLEQLTGSIIGVVLNTLETTMRTEGLLTQSQQLAGELQAQQTELQQTNAELANKAKLLAEQNAEVERKNQEIELARRALEDKAAELALTSRYKSEFLANMSHELRTPLNSILILGQQLAENADGNLSTRQVEFASTIHGAGTDLLNLISDILDLSKIESGTVTVQCEDLLFTHLRETIERNFRHEAEARKLSFTADFDRHLGRAITTDSKRLLQVLKNLLSNAFKFTEHGGVRIHVGIANGGWSAEHPTLSQVPAVVEFSVSDTGIGIPLEKQRIIFEAFQQADAGTSRKYGGTGLGLAISRELAHLLGGEIRLSSVAGSGSTFTLYLPLHYVGAAYARGALPAPLTLAGPHGQPGTPPVLKPALKPTQPALAALAAVRQDDILDDRDNPGADGPILMIVEDDPHYARVLVDLARKRGFKVLLARTGADALALARNHPLAAVSLDVFLPDMLGWTVLNQLKRSSETRHIPVQILTVDDERQYGLERGAFAFVTKSGTTGELEAALDRLKAFTTTKARRLLVVEDDPAERLSITELLDHTDIEIMAAATGAEALRIMRAGPVDCVVLDLRLPDMSGFELLEKIQSDALLRHLPIIVFTGRALSVDEESLLRRNAKSIVLKGVCSPERLLDETALFLHRAVADLPPSRQAMLRMLHESDEPLAGRKVLVVDDDIRNIFALNSLLERHHMQVVTATNGQEAINRVQSTPDLSLVLMDVMMPEMDGYETMRRIRQQATFRMLPIIALTAKAMKGDREKCLEAGASDYVAKPVNTDQLLSLVRLWLHR